MKRILIMLIVALNLYGSTFIVDTKTSEIKFEATKFMFIGVNGKFHNFEGSIVLDDSKRLVNINGVVDISSIDTDDIKRDNHLKEEDYFSIIKFPNIEFRSVSIQNNKVVASITIKGITKKIVFKIDGLKEHGEKLVLNLSAILSREVFMLNGSMSGVVSDDVKVIAKIVAYKKH